MSNHINPFATLSDDTLALAWTTAESDADAAEIEAEIRRRAVGA